MSAAYLPRFQVGATDVTLQTPMGLWSYGGMSIGSQSFSAAGRRSAYEVLRTNDLTLRLRVLESELATFEALLRQLRQPGVSMLFTPDAQGVVTSTTYQVQLVHPQAGESVRSRFLRSPDFLPVLDVEITIRQVNNAQWDLTWIPELRAGFTVVVAGLMVTVTSTAVDPDGTIVSTLYDWGDGSPPSAGPTHTYAEAGTYTITQTVVSSYNGVTDTASVAVSVAALVGPTASFTFVTDGLSVDFTDTSTAGDAAIVSWAWDFGDEATSTEQHPTHVYAEAGNYTVTLTVTDANTLEDDFQDEVSVASLTGPTASFTWEETSPLTVEFTDTSTPGDASIVSWSWDFGDESELSTEQHPTHVYAEAGEYTVTLTVTDGNTLEDDFQDTVTATDADSDGAGGLGSQILGRTTIGE